MFLKFSLKIVPEFQQYRSFIGKFCFMRPNTCRTKIHTINLNNTIYSYRHFNRTCIKINSADLCIFWVRKICIKIKLQQWYQFYILGHITALILEQTGARFMQIKLTKISTFDGALFIVWCLFRAQTGFTVYLFDSNHKS
jgi:hypothetical protein